MTTSKQSKLIQNQDENDVLRRMLATPPREHIDKAALPVTKRQTNAATKKRLAKDRK